MNVSIRRTWKSGVVILLGLLAGPAIAAPAPGLRSTPLAKKSGTSERMTFTAIPASDSGLHGRNTYDDPAMWGALYGEFQGGAIGSGIALGDVDGDGQVDIYVVNKTRPNQLFRQVAPFKFEDVTARAGVAGPAGAWKTGATLADIDNDGDLDLYVCRFNAPNLLFVNDGRGRFTERAEAAGLDLTTSSVVGAFEDYDRDGQLDVFVATNLLNLNTSPEGEASFLFRNRGDGTFEDVTAQAGISREKARAHAATWFDYNGDGWPDLYVSSDFTPADHFYRNNGDGTFTDVLASAVAHTPWFSMGADAADINNDGLVDFIVADMAATTHFKSKVAMGNMGGLVDHMDTLVTPQYMKNAVFLNSGTERFFEVAKLVGMSSTDWTWSLRFEDLDNDGWVDLHVTNGMVRSFIDSDLLNRARTLQSQAEIVALMKNSPPLRETNLCFRNEGDLHFAKVQQDWGLDHTGVSFGSALADFDRDGDLDLVYVNFDDTVSLYRNDSPAGNRLVLQLEGAASNRFGVGAQAIARTAQGTQTRRLATARGALSSSEPVLHFGLGEATEVAELTIRWPSGREQTFRDLPANARYVVTEPAAPAARPAAVASRPTDHGLLRDHAAELGLDFVNREKIFNDMVRQSLLPNRMNTLGGGVAWGDADGDGHGDVFFAGAKGCPSALYLNDGQGGFRRSAGQPWEAQTESEHMAALWLDVDRDGDHDLLVSTGSVEDDRGSAVYQDKLYLNDGRGRFAEAGPERLPRDAISGGALAAADFDRDGDLDVFVGGRVVPGEYPTAPESRLLENRDGTFVDVTDAVGAGLRRCGMVTAALWSDADGDGRVDLLLAGEWMTLRLFRNVDGQRLEETTHAAGLDHESGWWNSLAAADLNGDGHMDYVAGNVGLNTKYHASHHHPVRLFYGDFEGAGKCEIVEADYEGDKLFPVRGRSCSSRAMPSLKAKFPTFRDWGSALLPEIYGDEKLSESLQLAVTELASGVFLNDGKGHFAFKPLPRLAQASPIFGLAVADFTGDGIPDLVVAQNFAGPQVETGRFDGGLSLLLIGDGRGEFSVAMPQQSGIAVPGDARATALADWNRDGWPDFVLTRINEPAMAFSHRVPPGRRGFVVKLKGAAGNEDAIGARVTVRYARGAVAVRELHAGAGHLSQSEPLAFFSYTADDEPREIEVTWPDGTVTRHGFEPGTTRIVIRPGA